jgi:hypothetical protein
VNDRRPQHGKDRGTLKTILQMATERKEGIEQQATAHDRARTGNAARDERTAHTLEGKQRWAERWTETKDALRRNFSNLTETDLELKPGREQETIDRIGKRLNKTAEEAGRLVQDTVARIQGAAGMVADKARQQAEDEMRKRQPIA